MLFPLVSLQVAQLGSKVLQAGAAQALLPRTLLPPQVLQTCSSDELTVQAVQPTIKTLQLVGTMHAPLLNCQAPWHALQTSVLLLFVSLQVMQFGILVSHVGNTQRLFINILSPGHVHDRFVVVFRENGFLHAVHSKIKFISASAQV